MTSKKKPSCDLQKIIQVSVTSPNGIEYKKQSNNVFMTGNIYNSFNKAKQQRDEQSTKNLTDEVQLKQEEIQKYKDEVFDLKTTISVLQNKLSSFQSQGNISSENMKWLFWLVLKWIRQPQLSKARNYLLLSIMLYFNKHKQSKQFLLFGRLLNMALQMYQVYNTSND